MPDAFGTTLDYLETPRPARAAAPGLAGRPGPARRPAAALRVGRPADLGDTARFGFGTTVTQCAAYAAFDRVGNAQLLSRARHRARRRARPGCSRTPRASWIEDAALQGLRRLVEETHRREGLGAWPSSPSTSPTSSFTGCSTRHLDEAAHHRRRAGAYSLAAQHLSGWFKDQRRWVDALYKAWRDRPRARGANAALLSERRRGRPTKAVTALAPLAARADALVGAGSHRGAGRNAAAASVPALAPSA